MKKNLFLCIILLSILTLSSVANNVDSLMTAAEEHYQNEEYNSSIIIYHQLMNDELISAELYYNLANCYFKSDQLAASILYYEKARLLSPRNEDIIYNLEYAQSKIVDEIEALPTIKFLDWLKSWHHIINSNNWAWLSVLFFFMAMIGLTMVLLRSRLRKWGFTLLIIGTLLGIVAVSVSKTQLNQITQQKHAVVFTPSLTVKSAPRESGTDLFVIHEGIKVKVLTKNIEGWIEIMIADGNTGWIRISDIEYI